MIVPFTFKRLEGGLEGGLQGGLQGGFKGASRGPNHHEGFRKHEGA